MPTTETTRGLTVPTVAGDVGVWGGELNATILALAAILGQTINLPSTTYGAAATLTSSQAQSSRIVIGNTSSSPFTLNLNSSNYALGNYIVANNSSQGQSATITAGSSGTGGTTVSIPSSTQRIVFSDGTNITFADVQSAGVTSIAGQSGAILLQSPLTNSSNTLQFAQTSPTTQKFSSSGTGIYTPTSTGVQRIRVRMVAPGAGGGGGQGGGAGSAGGTTSFWSSAATPWTVVGGSGGSAYGGGPASGGTGGTNGSSGLLILRLPGGDGTAGGGNGTIGALSAGGCGGNSYFGGGGGGGAVGGGGSSGKAGTGGGGGGGGGGSGGAPLGGGGGGGSGEYAEFWITSPSSGGLSYSIGSGGAGNAAGFPGGSGDAGQIVVEEYYI